MADRVALLRGVNVAGRRLTMADLRACAADLGWSDVSTYIASGNLLFSAVGTPRDQAAALEGAILGATAMVVPVLVMTDIGAVLATCPFDPERGSQVHAFLCWRTPAIDRDALAALRAADEALEVRGRCVWLLAPGGIGRSALAARLDKVIRGTDLTARNLNTMRALAARVGHAD